MFKIKRKKDGIVFIIPNTIGFRISKQGIIVLGHLNEVGWLKPEHIGGIGDKAKEIKEIISLEYKRLIMETPFEGDAD